MSGVFSHRGRARRGGDVSCIFVHVGAGYHSIQNQEIHLQACNDAAKSAMLVLRNGGSAVDAVEIAVKVLEDREITNAGYGSNLAMDGVVECDASVVDHHGRSGGVGAVAQVKNPISLARLILDHSTQQLSLRRVPPNLLVGQGATDFALEQGMSILPHQAMVSPAARERWLRWRADLTFADRKAREAEAKRFGYSPSPSLEADHGRNYEAKARDKQRSDHFKAMLAGVWDDAQTITPPVSDDKTNSDSGSSRHDAPASMTASTSYKTKSHLPEKVLPDYNVYTDPRGPPGMLMRDASKSAFINSTQSVNALPTVDSMMQATRDGQDGHYSSRSEDPEVEMSDVDDMEAEHALIDLEPDTDDAHGWNDGTAFISDTESTTSSFPSFPSLTPSPPPAVAPPNTPLPHTPPESGHTPDAPASPDHAAQNPHLLPTSPSSGHEDLITDTVGAVAIDSYGNIACGASSGGIGMKYRGRIGPAALVGVGAAVVPVVVEDKQKTCVAAVTSGTGEHMTTTMAATVCAERLYQGVKRVRSGGFEAAKDEDQVFRDFIENDFMGHPSVRNSNCAGAIGILAAKKTRDGVFLYFAHNTDSFAFASMHSDEAAPMCSMSRSKGNGDIATGGRAVRFRRRR
ncbi:hypothetical protein LTR50_001044 [Elasticomyces elasticus]|nr:hypothetical protein LTR50_001044 [Elasticomyces elasticus]